jgi:hypothetical protein
LSSIFNSIFIDKGIDARRATRPGIYGIPRHHVRPRATAFTHREMACFVCNRAPFRALFFIFLCKILDTLTALRYITLYEALFRKKARFFAAKTRFSLAFWFAV